MQTRKTIVVVTVGLAATVVGLAQPTITRQPTSLSVSLGATAQFRVTAGTANPPLTYQWRHVGVALPWATNALLTITNVQTADAGPYVATVTDATGTTESQSAMLDVDPTFTKITAGALATDRAVWRAAAWGDLDNDGFPDAYIHQRDTTKDLLFRNNRDGTFTKIAEPSIQRGLASGGWGAAWGDFDNDGLMDLFVTMNGGRNALFRNRGDGTFDKITTGPGADGSNSSTAVWGDYDQNGYLDLFVANGGVAFSSAANFFYRNQGAALFSKLTTNQVGTWLKETAGWILTGWVDYDEDGRLDLFLPLGSKTRLYRNLGDDGFASVMNAFACDTFAWADYDNDGRFDLFGACMTDNGTNVLFHNEGSGNFRNMTAAEVGDIASDKGCTGGVAWGDYDNDGYQDLLVARGWWYQGGTVHQQSLLYHNDGDGTFTRIERGSIVNESGQSFGGYWIDYDRDGGLDLFISEYGHSAPSANRLYRNNGNSNNWLCVSCVGTSSPRDGTGTKVRARAEIDGRPVWQLRLINSGGTAWGGQSFDAHFGLGDATQVDLLRIEWPSGIVQELHDVAASQCLSVTEPARLEMTGVGRFCIHSWKNMAFDVQSSADLLDWQPAAIVTNLTGRLEFVDGDTPSHNARFYRAEHRLVTQRRAP